MRYIIIISIILIIGLIIIPNHFLLSKKPLLDEDYLHGYYTDGKSVFFHNFNQFLIYKFLATEHDQGITFFPMVTKIETVDNFTVYSGNRYAKSKENVYYAGQEIDANPSTFIALSEEFAKDENKVFYLGKIHPYDANTFEIIDDGLVKDKLGVYSCCWHLREGIDPETYETLEYFYSKDKNNIYFSLKILEDADPKTFEYLGEGFAKDKNQVYVGQKILQGANPKTFEVISNEKGKDDKFVYDFWGNKQPLTALS